ncbi:winged helix-turn-helix transcriptional regulator [Planosporangium thailandense]|uniref:Winged helix-turn-helix transcriptional regulator n=1 Tax=Planosporangium thailandense TaxID=765197 RepID=A0ABX0XT41_9ACTN|nr:MarR family winged helix-turn-helix transcriptional regulator [Planosporangium thailandense]NJC69171.1 winged helix-turn-helix transcriptional regulator [Planosporangium thailandense]
MVPEITSTPCDDAARVCGALDADLGWALGVVFRSYLKVTNAVLADVPGGPRGYQVLASAAGGRPGTQLALAQQLGVDRTVMTYLLDDLERAGLVERRPDPTDRRARRIAVTGHGEEILARLTERLRQAEEHLLGSLDDPDRATFRTILQRLATRIDDLDPTPDACTVAREITETPTPPRRVSA